jgi:hypothetical protein
MGARGFGVKTRKAHRGTRGEAPAEAFQGGALC